MSGERSIFITGAAAGIGAATARLFAGRGWRVGASDVDGAKLAALQAEFGAGRVFTQIADVRDFTSVDAAIRAFTAGGGGRLDALFANAGIAYLGPHEQLTREQKDRIIDVNARGVVNTIDAAFPFLRATPGAHVVAMASTSAEYGSPQHAVYSATKFFVRGLTEALNVEYRAHDIQVSAIYVAYVRTALVLDANVKPASIDRLGIKVTPEQVAGKVWQAVHGDRVHWRVGFDARLLNVLTRLLGSGMAPIVGRLMRS